MKKEWFFDRFCGRQFAALVENGRLAEFSVEREDLGTIVGNVYKGKVVNVLSGMNAAFISCGLEKNCYLSMEETFTDYTKYDGSLKATGENALKLKVGDEIIVQITKPPRGTKGAKVTTNLSFVGKHIIYLPHTEFLGISRKITDETQREMLLKTAESMREHSGEGFIVRTQAPFATEQELQAETAYLKRLYAQVCKDAESAKIGDVLYRDDELPVRIMRDSFGDELVSIRVGDEELYQKLRELIRLRGDVPESKLVKYDGDKSMLKEYGITPLVYEATRPTVSLDNGAYLVIDQTEAMTVIDVNTGSYVGETNLEDTVYAVNLEAAREIARQVRLRNLGGIVVVDFIDMTQEEHRESVTEELKAALEQDKAKCKVLPMSEFCITQFTRKRVGNEAMSFLVKPCGHCGGTGEVHEDIFTFMQLRAAILDCFAEGRLAAVIDLNDGIMEKIFSEGTFSNEARSRWKDKRVYFIPHKTYKEEFFTVRGEDTLTPDLPEKAKLLQ